MNLVVDYGNTSAKVAIFDHQDLVERTTAATPEEVKRLLEESDAANVIVSSVSHRADDILASAVNARTRFVLDHRLPLPIQMHYRTPETLGVDRIAGVCGGLQLFPGYDTLIIDAGTCITYDLADAGRNYRGGSISAGFRMRFRAVHEFTARLPQVEPAAEPDFIGASTDASIQSGAYYGVLCEIEGIIARYQEKYRELKVILTGGDAGIFENRLKAPIFASPNLVLIGLNSILNHNVNR